MWLNDGSVTHDPLTKAELLSSVFLRKQNGQILNLPSTSFPLHKFTFLAFGSSDVKYHLNDLNSSGSTDLNMIFHMFLKYTAIILAPKSEKIYRDILRVGSFPTCCRIAKITPIPKGSSSTQFPSDYRPISIPPVLSNFFED